VAPPTELLARAKALLRQRDSQPRTSWLDRVDAVIARLLFDSRLQPLAVRRAGMAGTWVQLAYRAGDIEVELQARRMAGGDGEGDEPRWQVMGQVSAEAGPGPGAVDVAVVPAGEARSESRSPLAQSVSDEHSLFTIEVPSGRFDVLLRVGGRDSDREDARVLVLPQVELG
jgi:hypothetical protein